MLFDKKLGHLRDQTKNCVIWLITLKYHLPANCSAAFTYCFQEDLLLIKYQVKNNLNLLLHVLRNEEEQNKMHAEKVVLGLPLYTLDKYICLDF